MASLAEINKTLKEQTSAIEYGNRGTDDLRMKFGAFVDSIKGNAGDRREKELEAARASRVKAAGPGGMSRGFGKGIGGLGGFGKLAGIAGMLGIAGLAAMQFLDGEKIKKNVESILSIGERYNENTLKTLFSDGAVIVALKALGTGLLVFAAGGAASAGVNALDKATMDKFELTTGWSENVKSNVLTLLSISDGIGESVKNLAKGVLFVPAMLGLSLGLGIFAAGSALAVSTEAFTQWTGATDWAQNIKDNVITLLSISDELGGKIEALKEGGTFFGVMTGIGLGLGAFGIGAAFANGADAFAKWISGEDDWAQNIVNKVKTLLSISQLEGIGYDTLKFTAAMAAISTSLLGFGLAAAGQQALSGLGDWMAPGEGRQNWAQDIKNRVTTLLSLVKDAPGLQNAKDFSSAMGSISIGLGKFAAANFVGGITNAITAIGKFFTGANTPFDQIMQIANNADDLQKGSVAVTSLTESIDKLGKLKFDGRRINMKAFALDLAESIKVIETAVDGGTFRASWLKFTGEEIKGLSNPEVDYAAAIRNIENLRAALRVGVGPNDITDRYGNTFMLPTNLDTILASGSGSGLSEDRTGAAPDGRGRFRIRPGFEENALDALSADAFKNNGNVVVVAPDNRSYDNSQNSNQNVVTTGNPADNYTLY